MENLSQEGQPPAAPPVAVTSVPQVAPPPYHLICLDRSKPFGLISGDRHPDDPHYRAAYQQGGLYFDVNDKLLPDDKKTATWVGPTADGKTTTYHPLYNDDMRRLVARRLERLTKNRYVEPEAGADPDEQVPGSDLVNLAMWLRGDVDYTDMMVIKAVREKHHKNVKTLKEAIEFLSFEEKMVHPRQLGQKRLALLNKAA